jgi:pimeloyl-ACP methyl ester carboxylesterase
MRKAFLLVLLLLGGTCSSHGQSVWATDTLTVYLLPGLGLDGRLFQNLSLPYRVKTINWLPVEKKETLPHYALRLAGQIDTTTDYALVGVSFGGMCASEIAKVYHPRRTVLISSASSRQEIPFRIKQLKVLPLHRLFGDAGCRWYANTARRSFGIRTPEEAQLFDAMLQTMPPKYFPRAVDCILTWKSASAPPPLVHLHGDADRILPFSKSRGAVRIAQGTHLMVLTQPDKLQAALLQALSDQSVSQQPHRK